MLKLHTGTPLFKILDPPHTSTCHLHQFLWLPLFFHAHAMYVTHTLQPCHVNLHRPKGNTCKTCDSLNVRIAAEEDPTAKQQLQLERQLHHTAEGVYQQLKENTALCRSSTEIDMVTFDLEQSPPTPKLSTNVVLLQKTYVDI